MSGDNCFYIAQIMDEHAMNNNNETDSYCYSEWPVSVHSREIETEG